MIRSHFKTYFQAAISAFGLHLRDFRLPYPDGVCSPQITSIRLKIQNFSSESGFKITSKKKSLSYFFLFCFTAIFNGCSNQVPSQNFSEQPDQWIEHFTITETLGGIPVWILDSKIAQVYNKRKKVTLDEIHIQFMNPPQWRKKQTQKSLLLAKKNQKLSARLTAPKGEVQLENRNLKAWGGVEVQSEDGTKLYAEDLLYSTSLEKITTESPIKIVRSDSILIGEGLEAAPDLSTVKILRHQASIYPKKVKIK